MNDKKNSQQEQEWKASVQQTIQRFPERHEAFTTSSNIEVDRLYYPAKDTLGFPGQYPYTRGIQPTMYRSRYSTMRQYAGFGSASETNERLRYLLDQGQTGLSVAFEDRKSTRLNSSH